MSRATTNRLYRNFTKGLITEASPLTYPENSCIDLDNCVLSIKGNIRRRIGIDYEDDHVWPPYAYFQSTFNNYAVKEFSWFSAANDVDKNFFVQQVGLTVRFFDMAYSNLSAHIKSFQIDMTPFLAPNATAADGDLCELQFASGKGSLFIVGEKFEPIRVEYVKATDSLVVTRTYIQVRDFRGVEDNLANDEEPSTLSTEHNYNLLNQGWYAPANDGSGATVQRFDSNGTITTYAAPPQTPITTFNSTNSRYPGNNKQWWVAKHATTAAFDATLLNKFAFGSGRAPRGHFILNAFYKDRSAASGLGGLPVESQDQRPYSVAFFSGRVWYACGSTVYYSQILDNVNKAGLCYQEADPTSEDISDLVASDGGVIEIPEMGKALKLLPAAGGILVFASNGVWFLGGSAGSFSALDIGSTRVTPVGTESPGSVVEGKEGIFYWDKVGIRALTVQSGQAGTSFDLETVSEKTIQSRFNSVPANCKRYVKSAYDPATNTIQWMYDSQDNACHYLYDTILNLDLTLKSFYPWSFTVDGPRLIGMFITPTINVSGSTSSRDTFIKYAVVGPNAVSYYFAFAFLKDRNFEDWASFEDGGFDYLSYLESGYELLDDAMRKKEANYVFCYFSRTEQNYVADGEDYVPDYPSSCKLQLKWDWASSQVSNKYTSKVEAYRIGRTPSVDVSDLTFDTGFPVVVSKNKVRGTGRAIQFRFESNGPGYDFDLLGWAVPISGNTAP